MRPTVHEPVQRVAVRVTFLRLESPPVGPAPALPQGHDIRPRPDCGVAEFRALYDGVGANHLWWLRRTLSDGDLAAHLAKSDVAVHVLERSSRATGFHEIERVDRETVNINYFGLFPDAVGHGLGGPFLRHAIDLGFAWGARSLTVNTCTADHPRALRTYQAAGFVVTRAVDEIWQVPTRLGLTIPSGLRRL